MLAAIIEWSVASSLFAAEPLTTKTFPVASSWITEGQTDEAKEWKGKSPLIPGDVGAPPKWRGSQAILEAYGVQFPEGASAVFDPQTSTLTVTSTADNLHLVAGCLDTLSERWAKSLQIQLQVVQAPAALAQEAASSAAAKADHAAQLKLLMQSADKAVKPVATSYFEAKSGQKASTAAALQHEHLTDVSTNEQGDRTLGIEMHPVGLRLELDAVVGPDQRAVDINMALDLDSALPTEHGDIVTLPPSGLRAKQFRTSFHTQHLVTNLTMTDGGTRLLGVWQPDGNVEAKGSMWLAFLTVRVARLSPSKRPETASPDLADLKAPLGMKLQESPMPFFGIDFEDHSLPVNPAAGDDFLLTDGYRVPRLAMQKYLERRGVSFPEGSFVKEGPHGQTVACNTPANLELISGILDEAAAGVARCLKFTVHTIRAPGTLIREAQARNAQADGTNATMLAALLEKAKSGQATVVGTLHTITKSGQKASISASAEHTALADFHTDKRGCPILHTRIKPVGLSMEFDSFKHDQDGTVDIDLQYRHGGPPEIRRATQMESPNDAKKSYETELETTPVAELTLSTVLASGTTKLLGLWPVISYNNPENMDMVEAAFITCDSVMITPGKSMLIPAPSPPQASPKAPPAKPGQMETRSFSVPSDVTSTSSGLPSIAADTAPPTTPATTQSKGTAIIDILRGQGIPFPEGSSATLSATTNILVVTNTRRNLELVELFVNSLRAKNPKIISLTTHLIETPGPLARELIRDSQSLLDAQPQLRHLLDVTKQSKARVVDLLVLQTKSGQRATTGHGLDRICSTGVGFDEKGLPKIENITRKVGFNLDLDAVIGPDGWTTDLNCTLEHHSAPPHERVLAVKYPAGLDGRAELTTLDFHTDKVTSSFRVGSGTTVLLGAWRPDSIEQDVMHLAFLTTHIVSVGMPDDDAH